MGKCWPEALTCQGASSQWGGVCLVRSVGEHNMNRESPVIHRLKFSATFQTPFTIVDASCSGGGATLFPLLMVTNWTTKWQNLSFQKYLEGNEHMQLHDSRLGLRMVTGRGAAKNVSLTFLLEFYHSCWSETPVSSSWKTRGTLPQSVHQHPLQLMKNFEENLPHTECLI